MVVVDGQGLPLGIHVTSASPSEVTLVDATLNMIRVPRPGSGRPRHKPRRLSGERGDDSDPLRELLRRRAASTDDEEDPSVFESRLLPRATKPQILSRMLLNLKRAYVRMLSFPQARDITDLLLAVDPSAVSELRDRGLLAYYLKDFPQALRDLSTYLERSGTASLDEDDKKDHAQIWELVKTLRKRVASLN